jgi:hypothetical protein
MPYYVFILKNLSEKAIEHLSSDELLMSVVEVQEGRHTNPRNSGEVHEFL